jgi:hypothetical protein
MLLGLWLDSKPLRDETKVNLRRVHRAPIIFFRPRQRRGNTSQEKECNAFLVFFGRRTGVVRRLNDCFHCVLMLIKRDKFNSVQRGYGH